MKDGRGRRYDFDPLEGFAHRGVGFAAAALLELAERYFDLIEDLPEDQLQRVPAEGTNSIAMLGIHMIWAEASWVARVAGTPIPPAIEGLVGAGRQGQDGLIPPSRQSAAGLRAVLRRVRDEHVLPVLRGIADWDARVGDGSMSVRGVLMHLAWHWANHTGQAALLRRLWGERYRWRFA